jgi:hypothetical protein
VENSLQGHGHDRIDLLLIHRPDPLMDHEETGRALDALVAAGKVRAVGVSNFRPWDWELLQSAMETPLVANQIELSIGDASRSLHQWRSRLPPGARPRGHGLVAAGGRAAFRRGGRAVREVLTRIGHGQGVEPGAVAMAFLLRHPARILPVMGTNSLEPDQGLVGRAEGFAEPGGLVRDLFGHSGGRGAVTAEPSAARPLREPLSNGRGTLSPSAPLGYLRPVEGVGRAHILRDRAVSVSKRWMASAFLR